MRGKEKKKQEREEKERKEKEQKEKEKRKKKKTKKKRKQKKKKKKNLTRDDLMSCPETARTAGVHPAFHTYPLKKQFCLYTHTPCN